MSTQERISNRLGAVALMLCDSVDSQLTEVTGATLNDTAAITAIGTHSAINIGPLGEILGLTHSAAVRLIDRLENRGLVLRRKGTGRKVTLRLTERGRRIRRLIFKTRASVLEEALSILTDVQKQNLAPILDSFLGRLAPTKAKWERTCRLCNYDICGGLYCPVGNPNNCELE